MGFFDRDKKEPSIIEVQVHNEKAAFIRNINEKIQEAKELGIIDSAGEITDGYHTFNELYNHRAMLFASLCNLLPKTQCWKSKLHEDGTMFDDMFIVGISTSQGQATYHYDMDPYWDLFDVIEIDKAPKFDGHTPEMAIQRIYDETRLNPLGRFKEI